MRKLYYTERPRLSVVAALLLFSLPPVLAQKSESAVPAQTLLTIVKAEDERRWNEDLRSLLSDSSPSVRKRAALAAGRIGNSDAVPGLIVLLRDDSDIAVRATAAFALGEIESPAVTEELLSQIAKAGQANEIRARALEAIGKIAGSLPKSEASMGQAIGSSILNTLDSERSKQPKGDRDTILLGLTAALRARPEGAGKVVAQFLSDSDPRIRADAANALARLRAADGNDSLRKLLSVDADPIVRANAARTLGATEDKASFAQLLDRAIRDTDLRVRVSAIRSLASLSDSRATKPLLARGAMLTRQKLRGRPSEINESLEIATTLGRVAQGADNQEVVAWLRSVRNALNGTAPEVEFALVRVSASGYLAELGAGDAGVKKVQETLILHWKAGASLAQALGEIANLTVSASEREHAVTLLRSMLDYKNSGIKIRTLIATQPEKGVPDVLRALALHKAEGLETVLQEHLRSPDVIVRAVSAELLGELPPSESTTRDLIAALPAAMRDELNDASLAILDALAKQKNSAANKAIESGLSSSDYLIRQRAAALLQENGLGDFSARVGPVRSRYTAADYERAISRSGKPVRAVVSTSKGTFTLELLPDAAPLNVDSFIQLARAGYFRGLTFHRVVPNFVIQGGDPRGDGNGGPGYQLRCEINDVPYDRGVVGMALSGKDTGGSQWFVTHSPQPHLDGGYTVFGRIVVGMEVVDNITRGDLIRAITVNEGKPGVTRTRRRD